MIENITKKIMFGGIEKYANELNSDVQINVSLKDNEIVYQICQNWQPKFNVTFKDILNKKIDILGYEQIASPFLKQSIEFYSKTREIELDKTNIFIFKHKENIALAIYNEFQNVGLNTLTKHFELLGM